MSVKFFAGAILLLSTTFMSAVASDTEVSQWSSFRNGGRSTVAGRLPAEWSPASGIEWQVETDGYGQSAPVILGGTIFVTAAVGTMKEDCAITAYNLSTGKADWQHRWKAAVTGPSTYMYSRAAPTPVVDTDGVYAFFESGDLVAIGMDGKPVWHRNLNEDFGPFQSNHGLGSSLAHSDEMIFLNLEHKGPSKLVAFSKSDGKTMWQVERPSGSSWTSPVVSDENVIVSSAGKLTAYSVAEGKELWSIDGLEGNSVPSPCVVGDRVFTGARIPEFGSASDAAKSNLCVRISGAEPSAEVTWRSSGAVCDYASPVFADGYVYFLNKVGVLGCLDAETGDQVYRTRLGAECWATPIVAENGIYFFARNGTVKVIARGPEFQLIQTNQMWDPENPPTPETYKEGTASGHGHGGGGPAAKGNSQGRGSPGGMIGAMMKSDANQDGILQEEELSADFRPMLKRIDKNGDGSIDQKELAEMAKSFAERRKNSRNSSRDPIVYGVAAVSEKLVVRTGTRLFCVSGSTEISTSVTAGDE